MNRCVHTSHCCVLHGCKYGDTDCPVVNKEADQEYVCETCSEYGINDLHSLNQAKSLEGPVDLTKDDCDFLRLTTTDWKLNIKLALLGQKILNERGRW